MGVRFMRMDAHGRPDIGITIGHSDHAVPLALTGGDVQEAGNAALPRTVEDFGLAFDQAFVVEVAVAIDQPHAASSSSSGSSRRGKSGVGAESLKSLSAKGEYQ